MTKRNIDTVIECDIEELVVFVFITCKLIAYVNLHTHNHFADGVLMH